MAEAKRKPKAGAPRTEVFAMRLDPKLKYLAEIAARKQRRSLANFIEWAIEQALSRSVLVETGIGGSDRSVLDEASNLWDLEPSDRFLMLAENHPDLLTYEEQIILKAIHEIKVWESFEDKDGKSYSLIYEFVAGEGKNKKPDRFAVKDCWHTLVAYAEGQATVQDVMDILKEKVPF